MNDELRRELADKHGIYVDDFLGQGGFGQVHRAHKEAAGVREWFALKSSLQPLDEGGEAVQKELRGLEQVKDYTSHPYIVGLLGILVVDGFLITLWQLADECLAKRLKRWQQQGQSGLPRHELCKFMREAAIGIDFLNSNKVYHRDIKPGNLLVFHDCVNLSQQRFRSRFKVCRHAIHQTSSPARCSILASMSPSVRRLLFAPDPANAAGSRR
jgi:serine/threonine protein kinase